MKQVDDSLGAIARPSRVHFVTVLPKTRSGKLLRRSIPVSYTHLDVYKRQERELKLGLPLADIRERMRDREQEGQDTRRA